MISPQRTEVTRIVMGSGEKDEPLLSGRIVYIVDDDPSVRNALTRYLAVIGMDVMGFDSAEQFLAQLAGLPAGLLIVDMQLPGICGLQLIREMARAGIHWPTVVISGSHEGHEDEVALEVGPDRYLRKPFDAEALLRALHFAGIEE